jgi:hypothetical protein
MTRASSLLLLLVFANASAQDLSTWKYRKRIALTPGEDVAVARLDREVYVATEGGWPSKMRIIRDGENVSSIFTISGVRIEGFWISPKILSRSAIAGVGVQFTMKDMAGRNNVSIATKVQNFRNRVRIETSPNGEQWTVVRESGEIFRVWESRIESLTVDYPMSTNPFIRVTILGWADATSIGDGRYSCNQPASWGELAAATPQMVIQAPWPKSTFFQFDLGVTHLPVERIRIESPTPRFHRGVTIESSRDGKVWGSWGAGVIARLPEPGFAGESLIITSYLDNGDRFFRLHVYNGDDEPIQISRIIAEGRFREIRFHASAAGSYWLCYGPEMNYAAAAPKFTLEELIDRPLGGGHVWTLGPQEANPTYRPPNARDESGRTGPAGLGSVGGLK